jgi:transposase
MKQQQQHIKVNVEKDTTEMKCPHCGSPTFKEVYTIRKVPGLLLGQSKDLFQPFPLIQCAHCRKIVKEDQLCTDRVSKGLKIGQAVLDILRMVLPFLRKK